MAKPLPHYLTDFLEYCEVEKGLLATSVRNYAVFLHKFFAWLEQNDLEGLTPENLTEEHITKYRVWLSRLPNSVRKASHGLTPSTQTRYLIALRAFLSFFHEKNIPALPTEKVKLPRERRERLVKFLTLEQVEKLLAAPPADTLQGLRDRAILETLFSTGLRVAELIALDRRNLAEAKGSEDFELGIIGKGGHPRTVYFSRRALSWLRRYLDRRADTQEALFVRFSGPKDAPRRLTIRSVEAVVGKYSKIAGTPLLVTPHTLRHSFATDLLNQGVDIRIVQEFLGHRHIATTQVYTHVTNKRLRDIHRRFHGLRR